MFVKAEPHLELTRASTMGLLSKIVNGFQFFCKNLHHRCSTGFQYASEQTGTFKIKLRLAKSSRLLQRAAFYVLSAEIKNLY